MFHRLCHASAVCATPGSSESRPVSTVILKTGNGASRRTVAPVSETSGAVFAEEPPHPDAIATRAATARVRRTRRIRRGATNAILPHPPAFKPGEPSRGFRPTRKPASLDAGLPRRSRLGRDGDQVAERREPRERLAL